MGKGKRNKQLRLEDTMGAPEKRQNKKQFIWPVWAKRALCIALLVAVLAGIIVAAVISSGTIARGRILVESKTGKFDMNQQMATYILWQTMYQQGYNQWIYQKYAGWDYGIDLDLHKSPDQYAITLATYYTKEALNAGLSMIKDYLIELVACADAAVLEAGLKYEAHDKKSAQSEVTWLKNIYIDLGYAMDEHNTVPFRNFLAEIVGEGFKSSDIEDAAKVMVMYSKYNRYKSLELQGTATDENLQDYILKNPTDFFEAKYHSFTGADQSMIRDFFTTDFMNDCFEGTVAKHYANIKLDEVNSLTGDARTQKRGELGLGDENVKKYTRTVVDGETTPDLGDDKILGDYIFKTTNTEGSFITIAGDKCAYLIYFAKTSTTTEANIAFQKYTYDECKDKIITYLNDDELATVEAIKEALTASIIDGDNTNQKTDNVKAKELLEQMKKDADFTLPEDLISEEKDTTKPLEKDDTNTAPKSILDAIYAKNANIYEGRTFVVNDSDKSYVVKVRSIEKDAEGKEITSAKIYYVTIVDDPFPALLRTFETEFSLYLTKSKLTAPKLTDMTFDDFKKKVVNWLLDENFKEQVLTKHAKEDLETLTKAMADSGSDKLETTLTELFGENGVKCYEDLYSVESTLDSKVYNHIFNSAKKGKAEVLVGKDDRVFLVYVSKESHKAEEGHEHTNDTQNVLAGIKEYKLEDYEEELKLESKENKSYRELILADLLAKDRKNTTGEKSADEFAEQAIKDLEDKKIEWKPITNKPISTFLPAEKAADDKNTAPDAIIEDMYPDDHSTKKVDREIGKYYQVNNEGTSYVYKVISITDKDLECTIEYMSFEDSVYYSYFRTIKSALDKSLAEDPQTKKYSASSTDYYLEWLFESEYKEAEGSTPASREFEREKNDMTFIATTNSSNVATSFTIYLVDEEVKQVYDIDMTVYGAYQLFETEKDAQKALKKLNGKTGAELLDIFNSFKHTEEVTEYVANGHLPGYVNIIAPTIVEDKESSVTDANLKKWFFKDQRNNNDVEIIKSEKNDGYYLAVFASSEYTWKYTARNGWAEEALAEHVKSLVADYEINEKALEKIDGVITTASTTAAKS